MSDLKGLFIAFEGGEGSGKSTQAQMLSDALSTLGVSTLLTREPGATELGVELRKLLLDRTREPFALKADALLFAADRAEHVEKDIRPALERGGVVICDRYIASTIAYQVYGEGLEEGMVRSISEWASGRLYPDLTFFLDIEPEIGLSRASKANYTRFESKTLSYHHRVRDGFHAQADHTWVTLSGHETPENIHQTVLKYVVNLHKSKTLQLLNPVKKVANPTCPSCRFELERQKLASNTWVCPNGDGTMVFITPANGEAAG